MNRASLASDVLTQIQVCLQERCSDYVFARTRGVPPADCNSITTQWIDRGIQSWNEQCDDGQGCGKWQGAYGMRITLTRICMGPDQEESFNWTLEDAEAACFDNDLELLEDCVQCGDWSELKSTHALERFRYDGTTHDIESDGGGYSAYIEITLVASECCAPPAEPS